MELRVEYKRLNTFFADYTKNLSKGGMFVRSPDPLPAGSELTFTVAAPGLKTPLSLRGRVMWVIAKERATEQTPAGMGVRFLWEDDAQRRTVDELVERMMREHLGDAIAEKLIGSR